MIECGRKKNLDFRLSNMKIIAIVTALSVLAPVWLAVGAPQLNLEQLFNDPSPELRQPVQLEPVQPDIAFAPVPEEAVQRSPDQGYQAVDPLPKSESCVPSVRVGDVGGYTCCPSILDIADIAANPSQNIPDQYYTKFIYKITLRIWTDNGTPGHKYDGTYSCFKYVPDIEL